MDQLGQELKDRDERLKQLQAQHGRLRNVSTDTIQTLQNVLEELQNNCDGLQVQNLQNWAFDGKMTRCSL